MTDHDIKGYVCANCQTEIAGTDSITKCPNCGCVFLEKVYSYE